MEDQPAILSNISSLDRLCIGTVQFGMAYGVSNKIGQVSYSEACRVLRLALKHGIKYIDTAANYGCSEKTLGRHGVKNFEVITKIAVPKNCINLYSWATNEIEQCLQRLALKKIYGVLLHSVDNLSRSQLRELNRAFEDYKSAGIICKSGVSVYEPKELGECMEVMNVDIVQAPMSIVDRRLQSSGWLDLLHSENVEIHARSIFLQGLLLMSVDQVPSRFDNWARVFEAWHVYLKKRDTDAIEQCLNFVLSNRKISKLVVGVQDALQLKQIIRVTERSAEISDLDFMSSEDTELIDPRKW